MTTDVAVRDLPVEVATKLAKGTIDLDEVLGALDDEKPPVLAPVRVPVVRPITAEESEAIARLTTVYGNVAPTDRRALTNDEVILLIEERETLDTVEKLIKARKEGIKIAVFNHLDVTMEAVGATADREAETGHYVAPGEVRGAPEQRHGFRRQVATHAPTVDPAVLESVLDEEEWAEVTDEVPAHRAVNQEKLLATLAKNPSMASKLKKALLSGKKVLSINFPKV